MKLKKERKKKKRNRVRKGMIKIRAQIKIRTKNQEICFGIFRNFIHPSEKQGLT